MGTTIQVRAITAILILCALSSTAGAGTHWDERFQLAYGDDVIRSMRCPPPAICADRKGRRKWKPSKRRLVHERIRPRSPFSAVIVRVSPAVPLPLARPLGAPEADEAEAATNAVWERIAASLRTAVAALPVVEMPVRGNLFRGFAREIMRAVHGGSERILTGIVPPLAVMARKLVAVCGARVTSGVRRTYVRGTRKRSQHWTGQAVDIVGNPRCMYPMLAKWPGGYSTDYTRVKPNHLHLSWGGREHGKRFVHGGGKRKYARRHHRVG